MNREARRRKIQTKQTPGIYAGAAPQKEVMVGTDYLHDGQRVIVRYSRALTYIQMTPEQVDKTIENLQGTKAALLAHMAAEARGKLNG